MCMNHAEITQTKFNICKTHIYSRLHSFNFTSDNKVTSTTGSTVCWLTWFTLLNIRILYHRECRKHTVKHKHHYYHSYSHTIYMVSYNCTNPQHFSQQTVPVLATLHLCIISGAYWTVGKDQQKVMVQTFFFDVSSRFLNTTITIANTAHSNALRAMVGISPTTVYVLSAPSTLCTFSKCVHNACNSYSSL